MSHGLPANPMKAISPSKRDLPLEERQGFSRGGFAPVPHRHSDLPPPPPLPLDDRERDWDRDHMDRGPDPRDRRPYREDPDEAWERSRRGYEDWDRRPPPPRWEDEYDRPKRRRSPSPFGSSHRPRHRSPSPPLRPPPAQYPDPAELPHSLTFRQFADWFRASHPQTAKQDEEDMKRYKQELENGAADKGKERVGMAKRYERYRKEYTSRQLYALYLTHRDSPWFQERYSIDPTFAAQRKRVNRQGRVPTAEKYLDGLRAGEFDKISYDFSESSKRGSSSREHDEPEGLDRALGDAPVDDAIRIEVPPAERQVFVKTVPPTTGRAALEELFGKIDGFQYLALTEPAFKKSFHRVGWAQFKEGVNVQDVVQQLDNSKIDGFVFHMGVNASSVVGKVRFTAPLSNTLDRLLHDTEKAKALATLLETELLTEDDDAENGEGNDATVPGLRQRGSLFVQDKIEELLEKVAGDEAVTPEQKGLKISLDQWLHYLRHGLSTCYYCVASMAFPEELHRKCISHMRPHPSTQSQAVEDTRHEEEEMPMRDEEEEEGRDDHERRQAAGSKKDLGKERGGLHRSEDQKWRENLDGKLRQVLDSDADVQDFGGRNVEEEQRKLTAPHIKQEEASKYRCKECSKLFKAPEFVIKHIATKHGETIKEKMDEIMTFNNYVLDPQRLQPMPQVLAAVNDALPQPMAMPNMPFAVPPSFNPAFNGNGAGGPGTDRMMQQQMMMMMQMSHAMMMANGMNPAGQGGYGGAPQGGGSLADRVGGYASADAPPGPPLPAGPEDPRAKRGRVSYLDLDEPGGAGDGGLPY